MGVGREPEFSQYKALPEVEVTRLRQCLAGCNRDDCKITCSHISRSLLHRLRDTPSGARLGVSVCWCRCTASPSLEPHAGSAPHSLLLLAAGGLLGLAANLVLHLIKLAQGAVQCSEAVGCFLSPIVFLSYVIFNSKEPKEKGRRKADSAALHPSACQPLGTDCSRKPGVPRPISESYLILSHAHNLPAQNTALW